MALIVPTAPPAGGQVLFPLRDRVLPSAARPAKARAALAAHRYKLPDGSSIVISVAAGFKATKAQTQDFADHFFGSLLHGSEMSKLHVRVETQEGVKMACGAADVLACYAPGHDLMVVPGKPTPSGQFPQEYVIAHEYGHHIAAHRSNDPWDAGTFGPKRWASVERVCAGVFGQPRRFYPGDEGRHYIANPGENWAEAYAVNRYPEFAQFWPFDSRLKPTRTALASLRRDVTTPWRQRLLRYTGTFGPGRPVKVIRLATPRDGRIGVRVIPAAGLRTKVRVLTTAGRTVATGATLARRTVCDHRTLVVRVARLAGRGTARIRVTQP